MVGTALIITILIATGIVNMQTSTVGIANLGVIQLGTVALAIPPTIVIAGIVDFRLTGGWNLISPIPPGDYVSLIF